MTALAFRPLDLASDLGRVSGWMAQPHVVPWWELGGGEEVVGAYLAGQQALAHLDMWIVSDDGGPFAYVETYRVADDPLAAYYDARPGDRGFHLLVGPPERLGTGIGRTLVSEIVMRLLARPGTTRVICEPDVRNARMLACCRALAGDELGPIEQPGRRAVLVAWSRKAWTAAA